MSMSIGTASQLELLQTNSARLNQLKMQAQASKDAPVDSRMQQAAEGFEALFLNQMVQAGRKGSLGDDLLGGTGTERMQSMLDQQLTETASTSAGLGLADAIVRQFSPMVPKASDK